jgi:hypothetical protein
MSTPPIRSVGRYRSLTEALREHGAKGGSELTYFFGMLLGMIGNPEDKRAAKALSILGDCIPRYKPEAMPLTLALSADPVEAHGQIVRAVAAGDISTDAGASLAALLEAGQRIREAGELAQAVEALQGELEDVKGKLAQSGIGVADAPQIVAAGGEPAASGGHPDAGQDGPSPGATSGDAPLPAVQGGAGVG